MNDYIIFPIIGDVLRYPHNGFRKHITELSEGLEKNYPLELNQNMPFFEYMNRESETTIEELYVSTFLINSKCCLDIGYALFGEDYKRGVFMAELKNEYKKYDIDCGVELPDFLPTVLSLLPKLEDDNRKSFIELAFIPALDSMLKNFSAGGNVYQYPLQILRNILSVEVLNV